ARLKAPVGAPTQEAAVVWHELLIARHLLSASGTTSGVTDDASPQPPFPNPLSLEAAGVAPIANVRPTSAQVSESNVPLLVGGPLGGVLALSAVAAGAFTFRRRRRTASDSSS